MAKLADRQRESDEFRLAAAHSGGKYGKSTFDRLMSTLAEHAREDKEKPQARVDAAVNVDAYDRVQGRELLDLLTEDRRTRVAARKARMRRR